jgi:uncharacterized protein (DUF2062 family)
MGDSLMLVCAVLAALAAGVLAGYAVCLGMFRVFRPRRAETPVLVTATHSAVEG